MKYYTSNTTFIFIIFSIILLDFKFEKIIGWFDSNILNNYMTNLIMLPEINNFLFLGLILVLPLVLILVLFIGVTNLNLVGLDKHASALQNENLRVEANEFFIISFFRRYAYIIEHLLSFLNLLISLFIILWFIIALGIVALYNLGFLIDSIFDSSWVIWYEKGKDILRFNFTLLLCTLPLYSVLIFKLIYLFYVKTNYPVPKLSKINVTSWINVLHNKLNNNSHIATVLDTFFETYIIDGKEGFLFYLKRFELGSIARILLVVVIKRLLRIIYFITRPILVLLKAKYFYYLLLPFVYIITFVFNFVFSFVYNVIKYFISFLTFIIYSSQVILWTVLSIAVLFFILMINTIAFEMVLIDYTNFTYIISNLATFVIINTLSSLLVYIVIPEFNFYSNPLAVKKHFELNIQALSRPERIRVLLFGFVSLVIAILIYYYLVKETIVYFDLMNSENLLNYFDIFKSFLTNEYQEILDSILQLMR